MKANYLIKSDKSYFKNEKTNTNVTASIYYLFIIGLCGKH